MRTIFRTMLLFAALCFFQPARAQSLVSSNRILFVVETSKGMKARALDAAASINGLITSGFKDQLHAGDTVGIWTFDRDLHAGDFPLQLWTPQNRKGVAAAAELFLSQQKNSGKSRIETVLPSLLPLVAESETLAVLIYSDGSQAIHGTPFDALIDEMFNVHRKEMEQENIPFVTALVARNGVFVNCIISPATSVKLPPLPQPEKVATNLPTVVVAAVAPVVKVNVPLIMDYSRSNKTVALSEKLPVLPQATQTEAMVAEAAPGKLAAPPVISSPPAPLPPVRSAVQGVARVAPLPASSTPPSALSWMWLVFVIAAVLVVAVVLVLARGSGSAAGKGSGSLITKSLARRKK